METFQGGKHRFKVYGVILTLKKNEAVEKSWVILNICWESTALWLSLHSVKLQELSTSLCLRSTASNPDLFLTQF